MCPVCGNSVVVEPETGRLMVHGPEFFTGPYTVCSGSGYQMEKPKEDVEETY